VGVYELLRLDEDLRALILRGVDDSQVAQLARERGYVSMIEDALQKVRDGITTLDEVARVVPPDPLRERAKAEAPGVDVDVDIEPETEEVVKVQRRAAAAPVSPAAAARRARPLILAVDDAQEILSLIRAVLEDEFDVVVARDGVEALDAAARHRPDAILMDVMMPRMSGYEACKLLKSDPAFAEIPVLILSARGDSTHVKEGFHAGADDYLPKPFDPEEMELRLRALLRRAGKLPR
jgi:CheY-like chemotaxis protein